MPSGSDAYETVVSAEEEQEEGSPCLPPPYHQVSPRGPASCELYPCLGSACPWQAFNSVTPSGEMKISFKRLEATGRISEED